MDYQELARLLVSALDLRLPPVALRFVAEQPSGILRTDTVVPSACAFWREAEKQVFYAAAEDHFHCPLGAMVMGFPLPADLMQRLQEEVGMMCANTYVREEEVAHVPRLDRASAGIVYGPLAQFPFDPDAVILWLTPRQAMVMSEACGLLNWAASPASILGRPGCGAIPVALASRRPAESLGCVGMRMNTSIPEDLFLMVLPQNALENLSAELRRVSEVHQQMAAHYTDRAENLPMR